MTTFGYERIPTGWRVYFGTRYLGIIRRIPEYISRYLFTVDGNKTKFTRLRDAAEKLLEMDKS